MYKKNVKSKWIYFCFITLFYFFIFRDFLEQYIFFIGYIDELIAVMAILIFIFKLKKSEFKIKTRWRGYGKYILFFLMFGLISSCIYQYQNFFKVAILDMFLCVKFWLAIYVGRNFFGKVRIEQYSKNIYGHIKFVTLLYVILLCADWMFEIFDAEIRYGFRATQLMYSHPTVFAGCTVFLIMLLLSIKDKIMGYMKWLIILLVLLCSTLRSKALGGAMAIVLICYFVFYRKKKITIRTVLMFVPLVILIAWEQIEYYFLSSIQSDSARYQLLMKSFEIAGDHFPLGSGFGTFASHYSGVVYSPLYTMYGLANVNGLRYGATSFISDSFWPMIIGQTGYVAFVAYVIALIMLFYNIQKLRKISLPYYVSAISGLCYLVIASMAESAFVHPQAMPVAVWIGILMSYCDIPQKSIQVRNKAE